MEIIYISTLISKTKMNNIIKNSKEKPLQSIQKFHRLICEGLQANSVGVKTISSIPMSQKISSQIIWIDKNEIENGVQYTYIPFVNVKIIRQICTFIGIAAKIIKECLKNKKDKVFVCDILNTTITSITLILTKIFKVKCIAIVTDLPRDIGSGLSKKINIGLQNQYDGYIILTEEMNKIVNSKNKPHIVIEGLADCSELEVSEKVEKYKEKVIMYAGGLYEKYGVKMLIEAFEKISDSNIRLHLYGSGDLDEYIKELKDNRIKFFGVVTNDIIVKEEKKVTLLVNPRFTNEEYTKYSFPSKNMEYMASGTPFLTTNLPGMPKEYKKYVYLFEEETIDGYYEKIKTVLDNSIEVLENTGEAARKFILEQKNNTIQANKIKKFIEGILNDKKYK